MDYVYKVPAIIASMERLRPLWVAVTLMLLDKDTMATLGAKALDGYLKERAKLEGKQIHGVESVEDQCSILNGMDNDMNEH